MCGVTFFCERQQFARMVGLRFGLCQMEICEHVYCVCLIVSSVYVPWSRNEVYGLSYHCQVCGHHVCLSNMWVSCVTVKYVGVMCVTVKYVGVMCVIVKYVGVMCVSVKYVGVMCVTFKYVGVMCVSVKY